MPLSARLRPELELKEIGVLEKFDSVGWTEEIESMSVARLAEIAHAGHHKGALERVRELSRAMKRIFVGKDELIDLMMVSTIAQLPMLMLGTWGTAKSLLARIMATGLGIARSPKPIEDEDKLIAALLADDAIEIFEKLQSRREAAEQRERRYFEYLVTRFSTPEELVGSMNIEVMLKRSVHLRNTLGYLARAEIVFLDEVFKANSAILNALLALINERLFYNAGIPWRAKLVMLFGASNEAPAEADLGAFYDRFPVRALSDPVGVDEDSMRKLLDHAHTQAVAAIVPRGDRSRMDSIDPNGKLKERTITQHACVNDFRLLHRMSLFCFGGVELARGGGSSADFMDTFISALRVLRREHDISDRSIGNYYRLARARALFYGRQELDPEDCRVLSYTAKDPEAARQLPGIVDDLIAF